MGHRDFMGGLSRQQEIHAERDPKREEAQNQRQICRQAGCMKNEEADSRSNPLIEEVATAESAGFVNTSPSRAAVRGPDISDARFSGMWRSALRSRLIGRNLAGVPGQSASLRLRMKRVPRSPAGAILGSWLLGIAFGLSPRFSLRQRR